MIRGSTSSRNARSLPGIHAVQATQLTGRHAPWSEQDGPKLEGCMLVGRNEEGCGELHQQLPELCSGQESIPTSESTHARATGGVSIADSIH